MTASSEVSRQAERECVLRAQAGDTEAFRRLVTAYERKLLYFILRFISDADRALDLLQDVWLTVFQRLDQLRSAAAFRVWVYQIAHDKVVSWIRRQRREREVYEELQDSAEKATPDDGEAEFDNAELVHRALPALSQEHREVMVLRFLEDMSLEEIAEALRCRPGTVKSRLHYARLALRKEVERLMHG
ncbi:MAG: RNA polymerase sigma factor [Gemmatales bacterium]|nr:MAG: RNA polymerase sigma factor [Gemmatales bacterium]